MSQPKPEKFTSRILFKYADFDGKEGRPISYVYNREDLNQITEIKPHSFDNSQFIELGQTVLLEGRKCKVVAINFKLHDQVQEMEHGYGVSIYSISDPTNFNCQIGVFVEPMD